jgi:hypothetical protein
MPLRRHRQFHSTAIPFPIIANSTCSAFPAKVPPFLVLVAAMQLAVPVLSKAPRFLFSVAADQLAVACSYKSTTISAVCQRKSTCLAPSCEVTTDSVSRFHHTVAVPVLAKAPPFLLPGAAN